MATSLSSGAGWRLGRRTAPHHPRGSPISAANTLHLAALLLILLVIPPPLACHKNLAASNLTAAANVTQQQDSAERMIMIVKNNFSNGNGNNNNNHPQAAALARSPFFKPARAGQRSEHTPPKASYACEGNQLELGCDEGKLIHLVRANYGRFSLSICNDLGHSNLSTQCHNFRSFLHLQNRCNKQRNCSVIASTEQFGDACEGTSKYLEVQYYCEDAAAANQTSPGQLATSRPQPPTETTPATPSQQQQQLASGGHKSPNQPTARPPALPMPSEPPASDLDDYSIGSHNNNNNHIQTVIQQQELHCASMLHTQAGRRSFWNETRAGQVARQACPEGASGKASWLCEATRLRFTPAWSPDFTQCRSIWLLNLHHKLDTILATPAVSASNDLLLQQSERLVKELLQDLVLMSKTNSLYSEDLRTMDQILVRVLAHFRLLADFYLGGADDKQLASTYASMFNQGLSRLFEEQLSRLVQVVSSVFDVSQRQAWLEVAHSQDRKRLELRYLGHLRASASLLAQSLAPSAELQQPGFERVQRQPNVFAGLTVINVPHQGRLSLLAANSYLVEDPKLSQQLKVVQLNLNKLVTEADADRIADFTIQLPVLRELVASGFTRFLVVDVKKPDYQLLRQQLDSSSPSLEGVFAAAQEQPGGPIGELQSARVFGVFAIGAESAVESGAESPQVTGQQQELRLADLLKQWPISVDFKISPQQQGQAQSSRQCNSLMMVTTTTTTSDSLQQPNRCHTLRSNLTNHVCRCEQLGFVSLATAPTQLVPIGGGDNFAWQPPAFDYPQPSDLVPSSGQPPASQLQPEFTSPPPAQQPNKMGLWASVFIVFGLTLLVVTLVALSINFVVRFASQRRLNKKQGFLSTGTSILGANHHLHHHHHQHLGANGPTTGPLVDHNLMGVNEPLNSSSTLQSQVNLNGANQAGYKAHQQLYAAHYPPMDLCSSLAGHNSAPESGWRRWLSRPARWLSSATGRDHHSRMGIQHRVLGSTLTQASSVHTTYKGQFHQNGYTATGLHPGHHQHHHHHHQLHSNSTSGAGQHHQAAAALAAASHLPLAAPSSSTSSYVSSSAYYEEIGPGNLTKVNPSQLASTHTIVDPFKRSSQVEQQLLAPSGGGGGGQHQQLADRHQQQHHHHNHQQQVWSPAATGLTYSMDQSSSLVASHNNNNTNSTGNSNNNYHPLTNSKQQLLHHDLSQLQSQSSSASSAGSASTSVTTANGGSSTPRHYLFASPSAVSAYKSSMSQQALHHQQQQSQRFAP